MEPKELKCDELSCPCPSPSPTVNDELSATLEALTKGGKVCACMCSCLHASVLVCAFVCVRTSMRLINAVRFPIDCLWFCMCVHVCVGLLWAWSETCVT